MVDEVKDEEVGTAEEEAQLDKDIEDTLLNAKLFRVNMSKLRSQYYHRRVCPNFKKKKRKV